MLNSYQQLWRALDEARGVLACRERRYCLRNVLRLWLDEGTISLPTGMSFDDLVWNVCRRASDDDCEVLGWDELPPPAVQSNPHRAILCALIGLTQHVGKHRVCTRQLDDAYFATFGHHPTRPAPRVSKPPNSAQDPPSEAKTTPSPP